GNDSGIGFTATRNPRTSEKQLHGEYLLNAQYEDFHTNVRRSSKIDRLEQDFPSLYHQLREIANHLERCYCDVQDIDFVIELGKLWILDSRPAQRSAQASLRFALDLLDEGIISEKQAVLLVRPDHLRQLLVSQLM
ncbi:MAG TPA: PEP/pyruvate-binding domain-containing protein, partial [Methylomirabilota bacterium]|nr:PEP/pyruvate-binding domain-containing protein [Methylomirabilota bacterium]